MECDDGIVLYVFINQRQVLVKVGTHKYLPLLIFSVQCTVESRGEAELVRAQTLCFLKDLGVGGYKLKRRSGSIILLKTNHMTSVSIYHCHHLTCKNQDLECFKL